MRVLKQHTSNNKTKAHKQPIEILYKQAYGLVTLITIVSNKHLFQSFKWCLLGYPITAYI